MVIARWIGIYSFKFNDLSVVGFSGGFCIRKQCFEISFGVRLKHFGTINLVNVPFLLFILLSFLLLLILLLLLLLLDAQTIGALTLCTFSASGMSWRNEGGVVAIDTRARLILLLFP